MLSVSHCLATPNRILSLSIWFIITSEAYIKSISLWYAVQSENPVSKIRTLNGEKKTLQGGEDSRKDSNVLSLELIRSDDNMRLITFLVLEELPCIPTVATTAAIMHSLPFSNIFQSTLQRMIGSLPWLDWKENQETEHWKNNWLNVTGHTTGNTNFQVSVFWQDHSGAFKCHCPTRWVLQNL